MLQIQSKKFYYHTTYIESLFNVYTGIMFLCITLTVYVKLCIVDLVRHCVDSNFSW